MHRILVHTPASLPLMVDVDGVATNPAPDTATVTITRDDGTPIVTDAAATDDGTGEFFYTLGLAENDRLDILTATWTTALGIFTTTTEVVGGFLFSTAQALATSGLGSKTPAQIREARTLVETALEDACGVAFVPRYGKRTFHGNGATTMLLPPRATAIRSVTVDGVAVAQPYVDTMRLLSTGELYYPSYFTRGYANYVITFEHGYQQPPPRVGAAALLWAKSVLIQGPLDDRTLTYSTEDASYTMAVPGMRGSLTGIPEVDATITAYSLQVAVA